MSLLSAFLRENLLPHSLMQQIYYIERRKDQAKGSGTIEDPWNALALTGGGADDPLPSATLLDGLLNSITGSACIVLGPGTFYTRGDAQWAAKSFWRFRGSGKSITTLKLVDIGINASRYAIKGSSLSSVEISDLTIDANLSGNSATGVQASGIYVQGSDISIHDLAVINFGSKVAGLNAVIWSGGNSAANCVIENCIVQLPDSNNNGTFSFFKISAAAGSPHKNCVVRNCFADGVGLTKEYRGIMADGGDGTIIEGNRILNCKYGGVYFDQPGGDAASDTKDLIIRNNYFYNVLKAIFFKPTNSSGTDPKVGRIIVLQNQIDLQNTQNDDATGIEFLGSVADGLSPAAFADLIIRGNRIRPLNGEGPVNDLLGIIARSVVNLTIDSNWVDVAVPGQAVQRGGANFVQVFNNRTLSGTFLPVTIIGSPFLQGELTTDAELIYASL